MSSTLESFLQGKYNQVIRVCLGTPASALEPWVSEGLLKEAGDTRGKTRTHIYTTLEISQSAMFELNA